MDKHLVSGKIWVIIDHFKEKYCLQCVFCIKNGQFISRICLQTALGIEESILCAVLR